MAVTRMRFTGTGQGIFYLDLNRALSSQLRKLHRQKVMTTVYGGFFFTADNGGTPTHCSLNTAPNTWVVKRAINRGFAQWRKMIAQTLDKSEGMTSGKWNDFKVYLHQNHNNGNTLLPVDTGGNNIYDGTGNDPEWDYSTLSTEDANDQFDLMILGQHTGSDGAWTRVSLVESWLDSRKRPDPEPIYLDEAATETDPLNLLFNAGDTDDERLDIINSEGDNPPYDLGSVFGNAAAGNVAGNNLQRGSVTATSISNPVGQVYGFEAICGLVEVAITAAEGTEWELVLDVESSGVKF